MTQAPARKPIRWLPALLIVAAALFLAAAGGLFTVMRMEEDNAFCASCHTEPETTHYNRSLGTPVDLASFHNTNAEEPLRCIDCHSGSGLFGRIGGTLEGAVNAIAFVTNTYTQPAKIHGTFPQTRCLNCHTETIQNATSIGGRDGHWHHFLQYWQAADSSAATCTSCHSGHATDGTAQSKWVSQTRASAVCSACHSRFRD